MLNKDMSSACQFAIRLTNTGSQADEHTENEIVWEVESFLLLIPLTILKIGQLR